MTLAATIGGSSRQIRNTHISRMLGSRSRLTFTLEDIDATRRPAVGQEVIVTWDGSRIYGGRVQRFMERRLGKGSVGLSYFVTCTNYAKKLDETRVANSYSGQAGGVIIRDMFTNFVPASEGFNTDNVDDGPTIDVANFPRIPVSQAMTEIADLVGYAWWVDDNKNVYFKPRAGIAAPISLSDGDITFSDMSVERSLDDYRNRQWVQGGLAKTSTQTNKIPEGSGPDGSAKKFFFRYPLAEVPTVKVESVTATVGILQLDSGKDWYWQQGQDWIIQEEADTALPAGSSLTMTYVGLYPIVARADDEGEQAARAAVEGGGGIYEDLDDDPSIDDKDLATSKAEAFLRKFASVQSAITFSTDQTGLDVGQLLPISISAHNLASSYLVRSVEITVPSPETLITRVQCLSGEETGRWVDFFRKLAQKAKRPSIRENEVVERIQRLTDGVSCADTLTVTDAAPENRVGFATVGFSEVA